MRHRRRYEEVDPMHETNEDRMDRLPSAQSSPEEQLGTRELGDILENAIEALPPSFREVFVLRAVEELEENLLAFPIPPLSITPPVLFLLFSQIFLTVFFYYIIVIITYHDFS